MSRRSKRSQTYETRHRRLELKPWEAVAILLTLAPYFLPAVMQLLGLITGLIQAYIFAVLAMVYIASATAATQKEK